MKTEWKWAVVGNIQETRIDENGILRYGTSAYKGNTRVYLSGHLWEERLPGPKTNIMVIGLSRSRKYYADVIPVHLIKNVRLTQVYKPQVLTMMNDFEYCECWWGNTQEDRDDAAAFVKRWNETYKTE